MTATPRRERRGGITPGSVEPRFPGYDVLGQTKTWDERTRTVVLGRLSPTDRLHFFSASEEPTVRALCDRLLAQDDEPRIPVVEVIDQRLLERRGDGYRYDTMPEDWEAWTMSIEALDAEAQKSFGSPFSELAVRTQRELVESVRCTKGDWHGLPADRLFELWMRYACDAYYSHPWAWNEIGFGGPAYPRGYKNLGIGKREPWESPERDASDPVPWTDRVEQMRAAEVTAMRPTVSVEQDSPSGGSPP
jgi:hypothetical protein